MVLIIEKHLEMQGQYYKHNPNDNLTDSESFNSNVKKTGNTTTNGKAKNVEIIVPLKYLSHFRRTLEMPLINCEVNLILTWSSTCVITKSTASEKFSITDTKLCVPFVTFSTPDNTKLLQQLKSGFMKTINWNKYQSDPKTYAQNRYLNHLVDPSFQGVNRIFVLSFENEDDRRSHWSYYLPKAEEKNYHGMIDGKNVFDQRINHDFKTLENTRGIATGQGYDYTTGCLLDYPYLKENYIIIAIDLSKQQALHADPTTI